MPHCFYYSAVSVLLRHTVYTLKIYSHRTRPKCLQMYGKVRIHTDAMQSRSDDGELPLNHVTSVSSKCACKLFLEDNITDRHSYS